MKVLVLNSSPHKEKGGTGLILGKYIEGLKEAGAEVETYNFFNMDIKNCNGCGACNFLEPVGCVYKDDMVEIYPKIMNYDIVVYATPLYVDDMTGKMKTLLDRHMPFVSPTYVMRDGKAFHPLKDGIRKDTKVVLVSVCGFPGVHNFENLVDGFKRLCVHMEREFAGAILRPYAIALPAFHKMGLPVDEILETVKEAGIETVKEGKISQEKLDKIGKDLIPVEELLKLAEKMLEEVRKPKAGKK